MQQNKLLPQSVAGFHALGIGDNCVINGANLLAGRRLIMPNAFRTAVAVNLINAVAHRNGLIRAFRLAHIAIDTAFSDQ